MSIVRILGVLVVILILFIRLSYWKNQYSELEIKYASLRKDYVSVEKANEVLQDINKRNDMTASITIAELQSTISKQSMDFHFQLEEVYKACDDYNNAVIIPVTETKGVIDEDTSKKRIDARNSRVYRNNNRVW